MNNLKVDLRIQFSPFSACVATALTFHHENTQLSLISVKQKFCFGVMRRSMWLNCRI